MGLAGIIWPPGLGLSVPGQVVPAHQHPGNSGSLLVSPEVSLHLEHIHMFPNEQSDGGLVYQVSGVLSITKILLAFSESLFASHPAARSTSQTNTFWVLRTFGQMLSPGSLNHSWTGAFTSECFTPYWFSCLDINL